MAPLPSQSDRLASHFISLNSVSPIKQGRYYLLPRVSWGLGKGQCKVPEQSLDHWDLKSKEFGYHL